MAIETLKTLLIAMTPIGELRAAIPVALGVYKLNWLLVYVVSVIGNLVPVVFILLLLGPVSLQLRRIKIFGRFFSWLFKRTRDKAGHKIKKYGWLGLVLFVAIPLPITGAWTGSLIAYLFKIPFKKAFALISAGVAIAGLIVTILTLTGITIEHYFGFSVLLIILLLTTIFYLLFSIKHLAK